jgi:DNA-binding CsgD family transcriptional regulator
MPRSSTDTAGDEADRRVPASTQETRTRAFNFTMRSLLEAARSAPVDAEVRAAMEELAAQLASTSAEFRERFGPSTVIGDLLMLVRERTAQSEREAAVERLPHPLGLTRLMRHVSKGGLRPLAQQALRLISRHTGVPKQEILRREIPGAIFEALEAFDGDQTRRDGQNWRKDGSGRKLRFIPSETYTIPDLQHGPGRAHFRDLARRCLETFLIKAAGLTDSKSSKSRAKPLTAQAREMAQLLCSPSPETLLLETTELENRRKTAIAISAKSLARLSPRERQVFLLSERTVHEIATTMGIKEKTVWVFKGRIRKKLMPIVGKKFDTRQK